MPLELLALGPAFATDSRAFSDKGTSGPTVQYSTPLVSGPFL